MDLARMENSLRYNVCRILDKGSKVRIVLPCRTRLLASCRTSQAMHIHWSITKLFDEIIVPEPLTQRELRFTGLAVLHIFAAFAGRMRIGAHIGNGHRWLRIVKVDITKGLSAARTVYIRLAVVVGFRSESFARW